MRGLFITATGTEVGKTLVAATLAHQLRQADRRVLVRKPVASGVCGDAADDAAILAKAAGVERAEVECYRLAAPTAPDRAAGAEGITLDWARILTACSGPDTEAFHLIEGAGGLFSPLTAERDNADLACALGLPLLLVGGSYLGAMSHIRATLRAADLPIAGLVISESVGDGALSAAGMIEALRPWLPAEIRTAALPQLVGTEPWRQAPDLLHPLALT